jgi:O-antigen/teichoic acid export membrane protein
MFFFYYTMYVNYAFYEKKTYLISIFTIIAGGINIGLNYLWIPQYGYSAAAWTTLVSYLILFLLHYLNVRFIIKFSSINSIGKYFIDLIPIVMSGYLLYWINTHEMSYLIQFLIKITFVSAFAAIYIIYRLRENGFKRVN